MATVGKTVFFKDFDLAFRAHPATGKLMIRKNSDSIKQAVKNLLLTNLYERPYKPNFGSKVRNSLFEPYTAFTEEDIRTAIVDAIENYEPRIELIDIRFGGDPDRNELLVMVIFRPVNMTEPVTLTLNLERVR
jgi:phage baseplate assembly protein W